MLLNEVCDQSNEKAMRSAGEIVPEAPAELPLFDHDYCEVVGAVPASVDTTGSALCASSARMDQ
jgi:hypothetical protein